MALLYYVLLNLTSKLLRFIFLTAQNLRIAHRIVGENANNMHIDELRGNSDNSIEYRRFQRNLQSVKQAENSNCKFIVKKIK